MSTTGNPKINHPYDGADVPWTPGPWHFSRWSVESEEALIRMECGADPDNDWHFSAWMPTRTAENARLIAAAPDLAEAHEGDWADQLYEFLLKEFAEPDPTKGEAVTADVRPHFEELCRYMTMRDAALSKARGE